MTRAGGGAALQLASSRSKFASIGGASPNETRLEYLIARRGPGAYQMVSTRAPADAPPVANAGCQVCSMTILVALNVPAGTVIVSSPATRPLASHTYGPVHAGSAIVMLRSAADAGRRSRSGKYGEKTPLSSASICAPPECRVGVHRPAPITT